LFDFLGHAGFYRRFIKNFSGILKPLTNHLQKNIPFHFDEKCISAFEQLKRALISAPTIKPPKWGHDFEIICEVRDNVVSAILGQHEGKKFNVIHYASHTLNEAQKNYDIEDRELDAVVFACEKFKPYISDSRAKVYTNHQALKTLLARKDKKPRFILWTLLLQEFDLQIIDRSEGNHTEEESPLMEVVAGRRPEDKLCILFSTIMTITGTMRCSLGNTNPPSEYLLPTTAKPEV
jgi:hypothetical protein